MKTDIEKLKEEAIKVVGSCVINDVDGEAGHVMIHVTDLLCNDGKFDEDIPWELTSTCRELLALLTDPKISAKLPEYIQPIIGQKLLEMLRFFENIDDPACREAFDLYEVKHSSPGEDRLKVLIKRYSKELAIKMRRQLLSIELENRLTGYR